MIVITLIMQMSVAFMSILLPLSSVRDGSVSNDESKAIHRRDCTRRRRTTSTTSAGQPAAAVAAVAPRQSGIITLIGRFR